MTDRLLRIERQRYRPRAAPRTCDQCGCAPCLTWTLCKRFREVERQIWARRWREWSQMKYRPPLEPSDE